MPVKARFRMVSLGILSAILLVFSGSVQLSLLLSSSAQSQGKACDLSLSTESRSQSSAGSHHPEAFEDERQLRHASSTSTSGSEASLPAVKVRVVRATALL